MNKHLISRTELRKRGWTPFLIYRFLTESPDIAVHNARYNNTTNLYSFKKIKTIEERDDFKKEKEHELLKSKKKEFLSYIEEINYIVPDFIEDELILKACEHYNYEHKFSTYRNFASPLCDRTFIERICVNYLKHAVSEYELDLIRYSERFGYSSVYKDLLYKILFAIAEKFTWLADECERQWNRRFNSNNEEILL